MPSCSYFLQILISPWCLVLLQSCHPSCLLTCLLDRTTQVNTTKVSLSWIFVTKCNHGSFFFLSSYSISWMMNLYVAWSLHSDTNVSQILHLNFRIEWSKQHHVIIIHTRIKKHEIKEIGWTLKTNIINWCGLQTVLQNPNYIYLLKRHLWRVVLFHWYRFINQHTLWNLTAI